MVIATQARVAASFAVAVVIAGCGSSGRSAGPAVGPPTHSAPLPVSVRPVSPPAASGCDSSPWHSGPITVTHHVSVPPVPVIAAVRVAQHPGCRYDRIVLDIRGPMPGYTVRYVAAAVADATGQAISMPGTRYLVITLRPAAAHSDAGAPTIAPGVHAPAYPALASWALAGDAEGVVRIALGLAEPTSIRTGELSGRIYVDVHE
jgi:hypothetical protein